MPLRVICQKPFVSEHLGLKTTDMIEFITGDEQMFSGVFFAEEGSCCDSLGFGDVLFEGSEINADGGTNDADKTVVEHDAVFDGFYSEDAGRGLDKMAGVFMCLE